MDIDERVTYFAETNFRNERRRFGIKRKDRRYHLYAIGRTGVGKSSLLETMIRQDIENGEGCCLFDPHGDLVEKMERAVPNSRRRDLVYFNATDSSQPLAFNPLESMPGEKKPLAASGLISAFKQIWNDSWGPRLEHILRNAILALLDFPQATLADLPRLFLDKEFRKRVILNLTIRQVADFWLREYESYTERFRIEAIAPIQNKVGAFLTNPLLNRILTQSKSSFNLRKVMDEGKILLVNLAKGKIGEDASSLLGAMLVSSIGLAALSRADVPEANRRDFFLYLDEFQNFTTVAMAGMLAELRKFHVSLTLANQHLSQLDEKVRDAILGNVGTLIAFRVGVEDAEILEKEFYPTFTAEDLVSLPNHAIYLKLMIDGAVSKPFSGETVGLSSY